MTTDTPHTELDEILFKFASSEMDEMGVQMGAISENKQSFTLDEAKAAITAYISREIAEVIGEDELYAEIRDGIRIVGQSERPRNELRAKQRQQAKAKGYKI